MNKTSNELFSKAEKSIQQQLPQFDPEKIIGSNIDQFHQDPAHQRQILDQLTEPYTTDIHIGSNIFRITASPVVDGDGERLGVAAEWLDRTLEVGIENEIQSIVDKAKQGDLETRIKITNKEGFFRRLGETINQLIDINQQVINDVSRVFSAIAEGNINETIQSDYQGSFLTLKQDANATVEKLIDVLSSIKTGANFVQTVAHDIADDTNNLNSRTQSQSASLEQTAATLEQLTSTVKGNTESALHANNLVSKTHELVVNGNQVVVNAIDSMEKINDSSKSISNIINVIDEIAFQTNLLALNASVEAARAGDQGRGFAVVATEVRNLANRSSKAAQEIKTMIKESGLKIEQGTQWVNQSGDVLNKIATEIKQINNITGEISTASEQQYSAIEQISQVVSQMDLMTQENASLVGQTAKATEQMSQQAHELDKVISFFQLK